MERRADAHIHIFTSRDLEAYEILRRQYAIDRALVVGYEGSPRFRGNNAAIAEWGETRPWMACLANVPCEAPASPDVLRSLWNGGFCGVSVYCPTPAAARAVAAWPEPVTRWLNEQRAVVSFNAPPETLAVLGDLFARLGGCACLISHLGLPGLVRPGSTAADARDRLRPLLALSTQTSVGVKLSGFYATGVYPHPTARGLVELLLEAFGSERLCWGSDFPPCLEHVSFAETIDCLDALGVPSATRSDILGGNLRRVLSRAAV